MAYCPHTVKASLQAVRERYEAAMGALNESFYEWDLAHDRIFYSENMQRVLGLPREITWQDLGNRPHFLYEAEPIKGLM